MGFAKHTGNKYANTAQDEANEIFDRVSEKLAHDLDAATGDNAHQNKLAIEMVERFLDGGGLAFILNGGTPQANPGTPGNTNGALALGAGTPGPATSNPSTPEQEAGAKLIAMVNGEHNVDNALAMLKEIGDWIIAGDIRSFADVRVSVDATKALVHDAQFAAFLAFVAQKATDIANDDDSVLSNDPTNSRSKTLKSIVDIGKAGQRDVNDLRQKVKDAIRNKVSKSPNGGESLENFVVRVIDEAQSGNVPASSYVTFDALGTLFGLTRNGEDDSAYKVRIEKWINTLDEYRTEYVKVQARLDKLATANRIGHASDELASSLLEKVVTYVKDRRFRRLSDSN